MSLSDGSTKGGGCHKPNWLDEFFSMEKLIHVLGSIYLHLRVLDLYKICLTNNEMSLKPTIELLREDFHTLKTLYGLADANIEVAGQFVCPPPSSPKTGPRWSSTWNT